MNFQLYLQFFYYILKKNPIFSSLLKKPKHSEKNFLAESESIFFQVHRKSVKRGFDFTLMVVGESGLGKSTLVNSLFLSDLYSDRKHPPVDERLKKTVEIQKTTMEIEEKGVKLRLTIVDTPGFGDNLDGNGSWKACVKYVDDQFAAYFDGESGLNRKNIIGNVIVLLVFFSVPSF